ncbi:MAG TPA: radical SAM protein [Thermodesulfobacteriaceae bacterium]|nr:radical SAM protein [Thermodesulfobacteriaceae bacterium]
MNYCFGPVPSRRLGRSLGVDLLPSKTCNLNCVYCELGNSSGYTCERGEYYSTGEIKDELGQVLSSSETRFDVLTFTASGEPTLHIGLGELLLFAGTLTTRPRIVLTNSILTSDPQVRRDLCHADIILPSLDSAVQESFRRVNRPGCPVDTASVIDGLSSLRREFSGEIWIEILFVRGINHGRGDIDALKRAMETIMPDRIQLNTVVRPPAEQGAMPLTEEEMLEIKDLFGEPAEVIVDFNRVDNGAGSAVLEPAIMDTLRRRPMTREDLLEIFGIEASEVEDVIHDMLKTGQLRTGIFNSRKYYFPADRNRCDLNN